MALTEGHGHGYPGDRDEPVGEMTVFPESHWIRTWQRTADEIEEANGGRNPHALIPRFLAWWRRKRNEWSGRRSEAKT